MYRHVPWAARAGHYITLATCQIRRFLLNHGSASHADMMALIMYFMGLGIFCIITSSIKLTVMSYFKWLQLKCASNVFYG